MGRLIEGAAPSSAVKQAAKAAGAFGCTISGAGPTCVAVVENEAAGAAVAAAMADAFRSVGKLDVNFTRIVRIDNVGARVVDVS
jgi:homoserine kinase